MSLWLGILNGHACPWSGAWMFTAMAKQAKERGAPSPEARAGPCGDARRRKPADWTYRKWPSSMQGQVVLATLAHGS